MTPATVADVRAVAPELASVPDALLEIWLDVASKIVTPRGLGDVFTRAHALLAAHYATMGQRGGSGMVTSETADRLSVSYGTPWENSSPLDQTQYGIAVRQLIRVRVVPVLVV